MCITLILPTAPLTNITTVHQRLTPDPISSYTQGMKQTKTIRFNDQGIAASSDYLASIAAECLAAERAAVAADRAARAAGANQSTWSVNW